VTAAVLADEERGGKADPLPPLAAAVNGVGVPRLLGRVPDLIEVGTEGLCDRV
jgi:hypothetical protein